MREIIRALSNNFPTRVNVKREKANFDFITLSKNVVIVTQRS